VKNSINVRVTEDTLARIEQAHHKANERIEECTGVSAMFEGRSSFVRWLIHRALDSLSAEEGSDV
jgi:hypothetical protein